MIVTLADGCRVRCTVDGPTDGPPVLFVHGFPMNASMWDETIVGLRDRYKCLAPDLRGHGESDVPEPDATITIGTYAGDLAGLLDGLGETRSCVLVGLSMGGTILFEFFRRHKARVRALVLCDCRPYPETPEGKERRERVAQAVLRPASEGGGSRAVADMMIGPVLAPTSSHAVRMRLFRMMTETAPAGVAAASRAMAARADSVPALATIDVPTLLICGAEDGITSPNVHEEMHRAIAGSRLEIIPNCGHVPPMEQPVAFNAALRGFLDGLAG